jgi:hypothetical protein
VQQATDKDQHAQQDQGAEQREAGADATAAPRVRRRGSGSNTAETSAAETSIADNRKRVRFFMA